MKASYKLATLAAAALLACGPAAAVQPDAPKPASAAATQESRAINALADEYYESLARFEPVWATENGDSRFNDKLGLSISSKLREQQFALYRSYLKRLSTIPRDRLGSRDQTSHDILKFELDSALRLAAFPEH